MNLKVLFLVLMCLFGGSMICNVVMVTSDAARNWNVEAFTNTAHIGYLISGGTQPMGDPIGGGWPTV